jgi:hypothetical protein
MTYQEREAEAQRLMATLTGEGEELMITESGALEAGHDAALEEEEECCCPHCGVFIDPGAFGVEGVEIDGDLYCHECAPIAEKMSQTQCVCYFCEGKCLIYEPARVGEKPTWQTCPACGGKGWTTWLRTELACPGSLWPRSPGEPAA